MNKNFKDEEELLDYAYDFLMDYEDGGLFLTEYINSLSLAERLEEENDNIHIIDEVKEGEADTIVYIQNLGKGVYLIQDFFDEHGEPLEDVIGDDFVLIQKGLLLDEIVSKYIAFNEEIETVELVENKEDEPEQCNCCSCCNECTQGYEEDSFYDALTKAQKEYINNVLEEDFGDDKGYFREKLSEILVNGYQDGKESTLLSLRDGIDDILED